MGCRTQSWRCVGVFAVAAITLAAPACAEPAEPRPKILSAPADPLKKPVLLGRAVTGGMIFQLELEGAEGMWMPMGAPPVWGAHQPGPDERYHVEFKLTDPVSKTRIPYAAVQFAAANRDNGRSMALDLPPMWSDSGLHYSANSGLAGDGVYIATVTVAPPVFHRELKAKDLWSKPIAARFHFRLQGGKITEVSEAR